MKKCGQLSNPYEIIMYKYLGWGLDKSVPVWKKFMKSVSILFE